MPPSGVKFSVSCVCVLVPNCHLHGSSSFCHSQHSVCGGRGVGAAGSAAEACVGHQHSLSLPPRQRGDWLLARPASQTPGDLGQCRVSCKCCPHAGHWGSDQGASPHLTELDTRHARDPRGGQRSRAPHQRSCFCRDRHCPLTQRQPLQAAGGGHGGVRIWRASGDRTQPLCGGDVLPSERVTVQGRRPGDMRRAQCGGPETEGEGGTLGGLPAPGSVPNFLLRFW